MWLTRAILVFVVSIWAVAAHAERKVTLLALASEPIAYKSGYESTGIYVDILHEFAERLALKGKPRVDVVPYSRLATLLLDNKGGYVVTILFPNPQLPKSTIQLVPVVRFTYGVVSLKGKKLSNDNVHGSKLSIIRGTRYSYGDKLTRFIQQHAISLIPVNRAAQGVEMLIRERVDGSFGPILIQQHWLNQIDPDWQSKVAKPLVLGQTQSYLMVSVSPKVAEKEAKEMLHKMSSVMNKMKADNFIELVMEKYEVPRTTSK